MFLFILKNYLELIKPGIIIGNIILLLGGFLLASHACINWYLLFYAISGTTFIIASACTFNNVIDCSIDMNMKRTQNRVLVLKKISPNKACIFGVILGILGIIILGFLVNLLSMFLSIIGFVIYIYLYTYIYKKHSIHSTLIGSFSGSMPSSIGYTAVSNSFDLCCLLLYITIIFWQMSHFYSISIFRIEDYKNANIPTFSVINGIYLTRKSIIFFIFLFLLFTIFFVFIGHLSYYFLFFSSLVNMIWLGLSLRDITKIGIKKYSYQLFYFSIIVIFLFNLLLSIDCIF